MGKKKTQVRETLKRICCEYAGNVPMSLCLLLDVGGKFRWYGRQLREYVVNMKEMCQHHGACFLDLGENVRRYTTQLREYLENVWGMCQCRGACFFDVGGNCSWPPKKVKLIFLDYEGLVPASRCRHLVLG